MIQELLKTAKSVLILGFAREGLSTYQYLRKHYPHIKIALADQLTPESLPADFSGQTFFGDNYLDSLVFHTWSLVIRSPGISPHLHPITKAINTGSVFTYQTQIFFELCPGKIIGVTGTKGKSTTASIIHNVLKENGIPSVLVGNIGKPVLDYLDEITSDTYVVIELSSYQLLTTSYSPHIAVLQNIFPDHLDYHKDLAEYVSAKANIFRYQKPGDYLIYNADNPTVNDLVKKFSLTQINTLPFHLTDYDPHISTLLMGDHNKYNILPSTIIGRLLGITQENIYSAISTFKPLDTRLQYVGTVKGILFYSDPLATIPEATTAAIDALGLKVNTLIAGGFERGQKYPILAEKIINSGINTLILFPKTGPRIWSEVQKIAASLDTQLPQAFFCDNMPEAVKLAIDHTASGKFCLLSPAAPSFSLFKDYRDEHDQYVNAVKSYL